MRSFTSSQDLRTSFTPSPFLLHYCCHIFSFVYILNSTNLHYYQYSLLAGLAYLLISIPIIISCIPEFPSCITFLLTDKGLLLTLNDFLIDKGLLLTQSPVPSGPEMPLFYSLI